MICEQCLLAKEHLTTVDIGAGPWQYWCDECRKTAHDFWQDMAAFTTSKEGKATALSESLRFVTRREPAGARS